ncbi:MAG: type II and III secretion system protein [Magnetococcales bacterium]|nr:type II and III secretion system protein [Magnetococcales bacterium]
MTPSPVRRDTPFFRWLALAGAGVLSIGLGCAPRPAATPPLQEEIKGQAVDERSSSIPDTVKVAPFLPGESVAGKPMSQATYTVVVTDLPVREVLFALARDARMNVDILPGITGNVTLNAIDQSLPRIMDRIARQVSLRYQIKDNVLQVEPDAPYRRTYRVDYVAAARKMASDVSVATTVASTGANAPTINNSSTVKLDTSSTLDFWKNLIVNLNEVLGKEEQLAADKKEGKSEESKRIIWNESTGVVSVLANSRQHREVQEFIDNVVHSAQRQVLIEATVAEVRLSDQFQSGINWAMIKANGELDINNASLMIANRLGTPPIGLMTVHRAKVPFLSDVLGHRDVTATLRLLSKFGTTKVLSSPRITVLNNQTAILRVTTNEVYFQIRVTEPTFNDNGSLRTSGTSETQIRTVPLGFIMQVTPQISDSEMITLNIRPTIQRVEKWVDNPDPNLRLNLTSTINFVPPQVPVVQVQEMDSVLRVPNGHVAVMGGLMEQSRKKATDGLPGLAELPIVGGLFRYRDDSVIKSELVVFLRPVVLTEPRALLDARDGEVYREREQPLTEDWRRDRAFP